MSDELFLDLVSEGGESIHCRILGNINVDDKDYALLVSESVEGIIPVRYEERGDENPYHMITDTQEYSHVCEYLEKWLDRDNLAHELYDSLNEDEYRQGSYKVEDLGERMAVIYESMLGWWKPRYLVNHNSRRAFPFIDDNQNLLQVSTEDIDWDSLKGLPEKAIRQARNFSFLYPSFIRAFKGGVAEVSWQLNPDGRYFMDDDGFGMTSDEEITVYGFIDQNANVVVKFRKIKNDNELAAMREEAESIVK